MMKDRSCPFPQMVLCWERSLWSHLPSWLEQIRESSSPPDQLKTSHIVTLLDRVVDIDYTHTNTQTKMYN